MRRYSSADSAVRAWWQLKAAASSVRGQNLVESEAPAYGAKCEAKRCDSVARIVSDGVMRCARCGTAWPSEIVRQPRGGSQSSVRPGTFGAGLVDLVDLELLFVGIDPEDLAVYALHIVLNQSYLSAAEQAPAAILAVGGRPSPVNWTEHRVRGATKRCRQRIEHALDRRGWLTERMGA